RRSEPGEPNRHRARGNARKETAPRCNNIVRMGTPAFKNLDDREVAQIAQTDTSDAVCSDAKTAFFNDVVGCSPRRQGRPMRRREFITLLGGAAAWVSPARAQEPRRVIGVLSSVVSRSLFAEVLMPAFAQGLKDAGFVEGRNISIEIRDADGHYDRFPSLAAELVGRNVAAIYASDLPSAFAAKAATKTIPIVFGIGADA